MYIKLFRNINRFYLCSLYIPIVKLFTFKCSLEMMNIFENDSQYRLVGGTVPHFIQLVRWSTHICKVTGNLDKKTSQPACPEDLVIIGPKVDCNYTRQSCSSNCAFPVNRVGNRIRQLVGQVNKNRGSPHLPVSAYSFSRPNLRLLHHLEAVALSTL